MKKDNFNLYNCILQKRMSFWNLYTEQNKTPVYVATDYNKLRSANRRKTS